MDFSKITVVLVFFACLLELYMSITLRQEKDTESKGFVWLFQKSEHFILISLIKYGVVGIFVYSLFTDIWKTRILACLILYVVGALKNLLEFSLRRKRGFIDIKEQFKNDSDTFKL